MPIDHEVKEVISKYHACGLREYSTYAPEELRLVYNERLLQRKSPKRFEAVESESKHIINGPGGDLEIRIYRPHANEPLPALMYFHGGGYVLRDKMETYESTCRRMAKEAACAVCAVDYRLAPEHPFPAAPEDCYAATCWLQTNGEEHGVDTNRIGVWGESCGGGLAAAVSLMAREGRGPKIAFQLMVTPIVNDDFDTSSYRQNESGYILSKPMMQWFLQHYISNPVDALNAYAFPLKATNLSSLPPALVASCECDPLRDEGRLYADKLKEFGNSVQHLELNGLIHGFFDLHDVRAANAACDTIFALVRENFSH